MIYFNDFRKLIRFTMTSPRALLLCYLRRWSPSDHPRPGDLRRFHNLIFVLLWKFTIFENSKTVEIYLGTCILFSVPGRRRADAGPTADLVKPSARPEFRHGWQKRKKHRLIRVVFVNFIESTPQEQLHLSAYHIRALPSLSSSRTPQLAPKIHTRTLRLKWYLVLVDSFSHRQ